MKNKYDKLILREIDPNELYPDVFREVSILETQLDLLQGITSNGQISLQVNKALNKMNEIHSDLLDLDELVPTTNTFNKGD